jgi:hypothetical protein
MDRLNQFRGAWSAVALTLAFVRANAKHPFAASILPLIPTILLFAVANELAAAQPDHNRLMRACDKLLSTKFGRSHVHVLPALHAERVPASARGSSTGLCVSS